MTLACRSFFSSSSSSWRHLLRSSCVSPLLPRLPTSFDSSLPKPSSSFTRIDLLPSPSPSPSPLPLPWSKVVKQCPKTNSACPEGFFKRPNSNSNSNPDPDSDDNNGNNGGVALFQIYAFLLRRCGALPEGARLHAHIIRNGLGGSPFLCNLLVAMYGKCAAPEESKAVFDRLGHRWRDVYSWNMMIAAYSCNGLHKEARAAFWRMQEEGGTPPDCVAFSSALSVCTTTPETKPIHAKIVDRGSPADLIMETALINSYGKSGCPLDAIRLFRTLSERDVVVWNAIIYAYAHNGHTRYALGLLRRMQEDGKKPNSITFLNLLSSVDSLVEGKMIHVGLVAAGVSSNGALMDALVGMYAKCGMLDMARQIFSASTCHDVVLWTSMINALSRNGCDADAILLFWEMHREGRFHLDSVAFIAVLSVCSNLAALTEGKAVHACAVSANLASDDAVFDNALLNMYAECGDILGAQNAFARTHQRTVVSWTAMIGAYGRNGHSEEALELFSEMLRGGEMPNDITFVSVLSACSHAGLVEEGRHYLASMVFDHGIIPKTEHCICMVDLFGRTGLLEEAEYFISNMPLGDDAIEWMALLSACRAFRDVERGVCAAEHIFELDPTNDVPYLLLSNIYAEVGMWDDVARLRKTMRDRGIKKQARCSELVVKGKVHRFRARDNLHPCKEGIYPQLDCFGGR